MREVDRLMVEEYRIELLQMMENAGRSLARLASGRFLNGDPSGRRVLVMAGVGGNGGGALTAARRLATWGADVHIALALDPTGLSGVPARQLESVQTLEVPGALAPAEPSTLPQQTELIVDGLIGYSLRGNPRGLFAELIRWANSRSAPRLSLDTPSGLNVTTGEAADPSIRATATLTLALPKTGLVDNERVGELYLADIGVPPSLYARPSLGLQVSPSLFSRSDIVRIE